MCIYSTMQISQAGYSQHAIMTGSAGRRYAAPLWLPACSQDLLCRRSVLFYRYIDIQMYFILIIIQMYFMSYLYNIYASIQFALKTGIQSKRCDNSLTRKLLHWQPKHTSFRVYMRRLGGETLSDMPPPASAAVPQCCLTELN